ncbi:MAG: rhomboid family intramembrane serine protease, partial [Hyphomicrobium sp.]|nr:rhomboid family intramembrane serine protease [Hyphomicrobium sp.]
MSPPREPIFNVPWPVVAVSGVLIAIHVALQWMSVAEAERVLVALAFIPARYSGYAADIPGGTLASAAAFITHMLVHGDTTHLAINTAWFLAFGSVVCRRIGAVRFSAFIACAAAAGAIGFLATH